jgi:hypothetical protein
LSNNSYPASLQGGNRASRRISFDLIQIDYIWVIRIKLKLRDMTRYLSSAVCYGTLTKQEDGFPNTIISSQSKVAD